MILTAADAFATQATAKNVVQSRLPFRALAMRASASDAGIFPIRYSFDIVINNFFLASMMGNAKGNSNQVILNFG